MKNFKCTLLAASFCIALGASAQTNESTNIQTQKDKLRIQVERESNGQKQTFDKTYDTKGMSSMEVEKLREKVLDSLDVAAGRTSHRSMMFRSKDRDDVVIERKRLLDDKDDLKMRLKKDPRIRIERDGTARRFDNQEYRFDFRDFDRGMNKLKDKMKDLNKSYKFDFDLSAPNWGDHGGMLFIDGSSTNSKTVRGLNVYPNNPFNSKLNLRFNAPEKGDVTITVTDVTGKEIGKEKLKDFSGDYLGQIDVKGKDKGTFFVTVTQGEDGVVKRVVVK